MAGSMSGRTVVVTRPSAQAANLRSLLARAGARAVCAPVIKIAPPRSYARLDAAIGRLESYDWVLFTSQNAVEALFKRAGAARFLALRRAGSVGARTAAALRRRGLTPALVSREATSAALARSLRVKQGARVLLPRAKDGSPDLPRILRARGVRVDVVEAYRTVADPRGAVRVRRLAERGRLDAVTFTSASTAEHLRRALGAARFRKLFATAAAASIGPVTTAALRRLGARPVQAREASDEGLVAALKEHFA